MTDYEKEIFSTRERALLKALGRESRTLTELTLVLFPEPKLNASIMASGLVRSITKKCRHYKLGWTLGGHGGGRGGRHVWVETRPKGPTKRKVTKT